MMNPERKSNLAVYPKKQSVNRNVLHYTKWRYIMSAKDYTYSFRLQVVQEALKPENRNSISYIAEKYGVNAKVLSRWIQRYNEYGEEGLKTNWKTKVRDQRIKELERENAELREEAEILKKAAAFLADAIRK